MRFLTPYSSRFVGRDLFSQMERLFSEFENMGPNMDNEMIELNPSIHTEEADAHFMVSVDVPGLKMEDLKIEVDEGILTISGERKKMVRDENSNMQSKAYAFFRRSFRIPSSVDTEKIEAAYEDGVLELVLPKTQASQARQIEIKSDRKGFMERLWGSQKEQPAEDVQTKH